MKRVTQFGTWTQVEYEPGNSTRYQVLFQPLESSLSAYLGYGGKQHS